MSWRRGSDPAKKKATHRVATSQRRVPEGRVGDRASLVKEPGQAQKHLAANQFSIANQHDRRLIRKTLGERHMALAMVGWRDTSLRCRLLTAWRAYRAIP